MTRKEIAAEYKKAPPLHYLFARVLGGDDDSFTDSNRIEELRTSFHVSWVQSLVDKGYLEQVKVEHYAVKGRRKPVGDYDFKVTDAGIAWWVGERVKVYEKEGYQFDLHKLVEPYATGDAGMLVGKGIGSELRFSHFDYTRFPLVFLGLREGLFKFERYYAYGRQWEETVTVTLTEKGMKYFDALPRLDLQLECA